MTQLEKLIEIKANGYKVCSGTYISATGEQEIIVVCWDGELSQSIEWRFYDTIDTAYRQLIVGEEEIEKN